MEDGEDCKRKGAPGFWTCQRITLLYTATMGEKPCLCNKCMLAHTLSFLDSFIAGIMSLQNVIVHFATGSRIYFIAVFSLLPSVFKLLNGHRGSALMEESLSRRCKLAGLVSLCGQDLNAINTVITSSRRESFVLSFSQFSRNG